MLNSDNLKYYTKHQYLDKYPIDKDATKLILGTIHAPDPGGFKLPFFYGSNQSIWEILKDTFPGELNDPLELNDVQQFLKNRKIAISDTIKECGRIKNSALDEDLKDICLNTELLEQIRNSNINKIFCTSGFGKNNAFKLFYNDILGLNLSIQIKQKRAVMLDAEIFGRPVEVIALYSPSGAANRGITRSAEYLAEKHKYLQEKVVKPVKQFKIDYYRKHFS